MFEVEFDLLGLGFGACKSQAEIISIADVAESSVLRVVRVSFWKLPSLLVQFSSFSAIALLPVILGADSQGVILPVSSALFSTRVCWNEYLFDVLVQSI